MNDRRCSPVQKTAEERVDALALEYAAVFFGTRDRALMPSSEWDLCLTAALRTYQHLGLDPENPPEEGAVGKAREAAVEGIAYHDSNDTRSCDCRYLYAALVKVRRALGGE